MSQKNRARELERRQKAAAYHYPRYVLKLLRLITNPEFIRRLADLKRVTGAALYQRDGGYSGAADLLMRGVEKANEGLEPEAPLAQYKRSLLAIRQGFGLHPIS